MDYLGFPEKVLRGYLAYGDSVLLTNLIPTIPCARFDLGAAAHMPSFSEFDVHNKYPSWATV